MQSNQAVGNLPIRFRVYAPEDKNFILNSWLKSNRKSPAYREIDDRVYYHSHSEMIDSLIKKCHVVIAVSESDPTDIFGYIVREKIGETTVIHYAYVKKDYRRLGIGHHLLLAADYDPDKGLAYTHHTNVAGKLKYKYSALYNPYVLVFADYTEESETDEDN